MHALTTLLLNNLNTRMKVAPFFEGLLHNIPVEAVMGLSSHVAHTFVCIDVVGVQIVFQCYIVL